jgi:hypothetical protein
MDQAARSYVVLTASVPNQGDRLRTTKAFAACLPV